jgi:hypothetical protein
MKILAYPILAVASWLLTLAAFLFAPVIALFVDGDGNLPRWLSYFQTPDAPCWGADFWAASNPSYGRYELIVTWLIRNPAQGYDQTVKANVDYNTPVKVYGNINIDDSTSPPVGGWFLITGGGYFQLQVIIPTSWKCIEMHYGWSLKPLAKGYRHPTLGALLATPLRLYKAH